MLLKYYPCHTCQLVSDPIETHAANVSVNMKDIVLRTGLCLTSQVTFSMLNVCAPW